MATPKLKGARRVRTMFDDIPGSGSVPFGRVADVLRGRADIDRLVLVSELGVFGGEHLYVFRDAAAAQNAYDVERQGPGPYRLSLAARRAGGAR